MKTLLLSALLSVCHAAVLPRDGPAKVGRPAPVAGAKSATARFGPFTLPSNKVNGLMGMSGLVMKNVDDIPMPCTSCTYTYIKGDMVYKNGTSANLENGSYMHHITLVAMPKSNSTGLASLASLASGILAGATRLSGDAQTSNLEALQSGFKPFYLIGNERPPLNYPKAGVYLSSKQSMLLTVQLENMEANEKEVFIDMDYDYLPGQPEGYVDIIPVPQDALGIAGMMGSIKQEGVWEKTSPTYTVGQDARILMMYGHVHDGGIHTEIRVNDKVACDSTAWYQDMKIPADAQTSSGMAAGSGHGHGGKSKRDGPASHIVQFGECKEVGAVKKGDVITTKVFYDFTKRPRTLLANGKEDPLMGISMTYLGIPMVKES